MAAMIARFKGHAPSAVTSSQKYILMQDRFSWKTVVNGYQYCSCIVFSDVVKSRWNFVWRWLQTSKNFLYIFPPVCTCLLNVLLFLKENTCPENFSLIYNFFPCVKLAFPENFVWICTNICTKCITIHYRSQNIIVTADESYRILRWVIPVVLVQ